MKSSNYDEKFNNPNLKFLTKTHNAVRDHLTATVELPTFLESAGALTLEDRKVLVDQAIVLMQDNYVHLPLKRSMHGINPVQRLRLIKYRLELLTDSTMQSEFAFHREMLDIFNSVRDLHTNYLLPAPFNNTVAFLPFDIEKYVEDGKSKYIATHFVRGFSHRDFKPGAEIIMWNGVPIERAIEVNADRHAGSNLAARHSRGIQRLTIRPLISSLPPDELWVIIGYLDLNGEEHEMRQEWLVSPELPDVEGVDANAVSLNAVSLGYDLETDIVSRTKKMLFAPQVVADEQIQDKSVFAEAVAVDVGEVVESTMPGVFMAKDVNTPSGIFGYIRIYTFGVNDPNAFVEEFIRLSTLLSPHGLIIDVRGNGGGHIWASEGLLQILTPREIEPQPVQFINTPLNLRICKRHEANPVGIDLGPWVASMRDAVRTGAIYSRSFSITPTSFVNQWGQRYHSSVVLITDARCYSATDIFAAGFKDHEVGIILGVDDNTGAGGANVWTHQLLNDLLKFPVPPDLDSPYKSLPNGANMRISIRRTLRVGSQAGILVEDLGVRPDVRYQMSQNDLLNGNVDLINQAGELLVSQPMRLLATTSQRTGSRLRVTAQTSGMDRLDVYVNNRPIDTHDISDGQQTFEFDAAAGGVINLVGFKDGELVASRRFSS